MDQTKKRFENMCTYFGEDHGKSDPVSSIFKFAQVWAVAMAENLKAKEAKEKAAKKVTFPTYVLNLSRKPTFPTHTGCRQRGDEETDRCTTAEGNRSFQDQHCHKREERNDAKQKAHGAKAKGKH